MALDPVTAVSGLVGKILDKFVSDKLSPEAAEKLKAEAELLITQQALDVESEFHGFVVAYEGRGDEVHPYLQIFRGSVRPVVTYAVFGSVVWCVWNAVPVPVELHQLALLCGAFWFGERAVTNYLSTKNGGVK
jgi:hypothetical protein